MRAHRIAQGLVLILGILILSCGEDKKNDPTPLPTVLSINPTAGVATMEVTITGNNFSTTLADNTVTFNGVPAAVQSATATSLEVIAPEGTTGTVSVTTKGGTAVGPSFRYYEVFVVGTEVVSGVETIQLWRNVTVQKISGSAASEASAFAVSGNDIYIAGHVHASENTIPTYWKNGIEYSLSGVVDGEAHDIFIDGADIHVAGTEYNGSNDMVTHWKNGTGNNLSLGNYGEDKAWAITVSGGDVYIGGSYVDDPGNNVATYWVNGIAETLGSGEGAIHDIEVAGTDVHLLGHLTNGTTSQLTYLINGADTPLANTGLYPNGVDMVVAGSDVLVLGDVPSGGANVLTVWINGDAIPLTDGSFTTIPGGIAVIDNDIFISGVFLGTGGGRAFFAINDSVFYLTDGSTEVNIVGIFAR